MSDGQGYDINVLQQLQQQQQALLHTLAQFQLDFKEERQEFENRLRGHAYGQRGELIQLYEPMMNDKGVSHTMKLVDGWMQKIVVQSYFTKEQINSWGRIITRQLVSDCYAYGEDWALKPDGYTSYVTSCAFLFHSAINCALNGRLAELVGKVTKTVETSVIQTPVQKSPAKI